MRATPRKGTVYAPSCPRAGADHHHHPPYEGAPLNKGTVYTPACPRAGTATNADRHHFPYGGTPTNKGTDNAPTSGRYQQKPLERPHATDPSPIRFLRTGVPTPGRLLFAQTLTSRATDASPSPQHTPGGIFPSPTPMLLSDMGGSREGRLPAKETPPPLPVAATPPAPKPPPPQA